MISSSFDQRDVILYGLSRVKDYMGAGVYQIPSTKFTFGRLDNGMLIFHTALTFTCNDVETLIAVEVDYRCEGYVDGWG
jgi:hypothetical protein